jgi:FkbM family methyltransferase
VLADNAYNLNPKTDGEFSLLRRVLPQATTGAICFDIGAQYGNWTAMAKSIRPDLEIHTFDPFPKMQKHLRKRFHGDKSILVNPVAVSDTEREIDFFPETYSVHSRDSVERGGSPFRVGATALDNYIRTAGIEQVYFVKLDIEGHELFALRGAFDSLSKHIFRYIQFEYGVCNIDSRTFLKDIFDLFQDLPYRLGKLHPHHVEYFPRYLPDRVENFYTCNWVAERVD